MRTKTELPPSIVRRRLSGTSGRACRRGFTLVELLMVVAIVGVLAALAIVGVRQYLNYAKTAEAKSAVGAVADAALAAYERQDTVFLARFADANDHSGGTTQSGKDDGKSDDQGDGKSAGKDDGKDNEKSDGKDKDDGKDNEKSDGKDNEKDDGKGTNGGGSSGNSGPGPSNGGPSGNSGGTKGNSSGGSTGEPTTTLVSHQLCASALSVPASLQAGNKYQPIARDGSDFLTGDRHTGWKCLMIHITSPIYYRYSYRQGSGYVVDAAGVTPSASGFEASAQGDLEGTGKVSTIALMGDIDPTTHLVHIATQLYVSKETE